MIQDYFSRTKPSQPIFLDNPTKKDILDQLFFVYRDDCGRGLIEASDWFRIKDGSSLNPRELIEEPDYTGHFYVMHLSGLIHGRVKVKSIDIEKHPDLGEWTDLRIEAVLIPS